MVFVFISGRPLRNHAPDSGLAREISQRLINKPQGTNSFQSNQKQSFVPLILQRKAIGKQGNQLLQLPLPSLIRK